MRRGRACRSRWDLPAARLESAAGGTAAAMTLPSRSRVSRSPGPLRRQLATMRRRAQLVALLVMAAVLAVLPVQAQDVGLPGQAKDGEDWGAVAGGLGRQHPSWLQPFVQFLCA